MLERNSHKWYLTKEAIKHVIYTVSLLWGWCHNFTIMPWITILWSNISLRCSTISISAPWSNKCGVVVAIEVKWNTVVAILSIKYCFLFSMRNWFNLMKGRLDMMGFLACMTIKWLEVNCPPRLSIFLGTNNHSMIPSDWFTNGDKH